MKWTFTLFTINNYVKCCCHTGYVTAYQMTSVSSLLQRFLCEDFTYFFFFKIWKKLISEHNCNMSHMSLKKKLNSFSDKILQMNKKVCHEMFSLITVLHIREPKIIINQFGVKNFNPKSACNRMHKCVSCSIILSAWQ